MVWSRVCAEELNFLSEFFKFTSHQTKCMLRTVTSQYGANLVSLKSAYFCQGHSFALLFVPLGLGFMAQIGSIKGWQLKCVYIVINIGTVYMATLFRTDLTCHFHVWAQETYYSCRLFADYTCAVIKVQQAYWSHSYILCQFNYWINESDVNHLIYP